MAYGGMPATLNPMTHQDMLENAGRLIDKHLQEDRTSLDLSELLRVPMHSKFTLLSVDCVILRNKVENTCTISYMYVTFNS